MGTIDRENQPHQEVESLECLASSVVPNTSYPGHHHLSSLLLPVWWRHTAPSSCSKIAVTQSVTPVLLPSHWV